MNVSTCVSLRVCVKGGGGGVCVCACTYAHTFTHIYGRQKQVRRYLKHLARDPGDIFAALLAPRKRGDPPRPHVPVPLVLLRAEESPLLKTKPIASFHNIPSPKNRDVMAPTVGLEAPRCAYREARCHRPRARPTHDQDNIAPARTDSATSSSSSHLRSSSYSSLAFNATG